MSLISEIRKFIPSSGFEWKSETIYNPLMTETDSEGDLNNSLENQTQRPHSIWLQSRLLPVLPWLLSLVLGLTCSFQYMEAKSIPSCPGSFERGWKTDFCESFTNNTNNVAETRTLDPARSLIETELVKFSGSPSFLPNGSIFIKDPDPIEYNGKGPEVDDAWEKLVGGGCILFI
jgi:hypothetical protein